MGSGESMGARLLQNATCSHVAAAIVSLFGVVDFDAARTTGVDELETTAVGIDFGDDAHMADAA